MTMELANWSGTDKDRVRRSFGRAAATYDGAAALQRRVGSDLVRMLMVSDVQPRRIVDVGTGTGYAAELLRWAYPDADLILLDIAENMLEQARQVRKLDENVSFICGDAAAMPVASAITDVVFSNFALQWCYPLGPVLSELRRVLRPGGLAVFSIFVGNTLMELRSAWQSIDDRTHVNDFPSSSELHDALVTNELEASHFIVAQIQVTYDSVYQLMRELKSLGAHNATVDRPRHLFGKHAMGRMVATYESEMPDGEIIATFEVATCLAFGR